MDVRPIRPEDRGPLAQLVQRSDDNFTPEDVEVALELIDLSIRDPGGSGYRSVVAEDGELIGYACFGPTPMTAHTWDLYWIVVDPNARRKGAGARLCAAVEAEVREKRGKIVRIETSSKDAYLAAQRFYARLGYDEIARIADFYSDGDDLVTLIKRFD